MAEEEEKKLKVPAVSGEDLLKIDVGAMDEIIAKLNAIQPAGRVCTWCGTEAEHFVRPTIFTAVTFGIPMDAHIENKVTPMISAECMNCGHFEWFNLHRYGYTTKHGRRKI